MNALRGRGMCAGSRPVDALLMCLRFCCTMGMSARDGRDDVQWPELAGGGEGEGVGHG